MGIDVLLDPYVSIGLCIGCLGLLVIGTTSCSALLPGKSECMGLILILLCQQR